MTWVTGSTGSPGHMVLGSLGRWVTKCDPVPCLSHTQLSLAIPACACGRRLATDDMYTIDEVSEMLDSLEAVVRAEVESELIYTSHTNVLLIGQILQQVEARGDNDIDVDVFKLEDR